MFKILSALVLVVLYVGVILMPLSAQADDEWRDKFGRKHYNHGKHKGWDHRRGYPDNEPLLDWRTKRILRGGLIGAGVGAGAGVLMDKPIAKTAVLGAGVGAGAQAIKTSSTLSRHPIAKTAAYGALVGAGASQLTREGSLKKGALWGAAIGTGVGIVKDSD